MTTVDAPPRATPFRVTPPRARSGLFGHRPGPAVIAARGVAGIAPEHTVAAFEVAAAVGVGWVSMEVRRTADHELVLLRCSDLGAGGRPPGGSRPAVRIEDLTLQEARDLDVGRWHGPEFHGERLTTLRDVLDRLGGRIGFVIDLPVGPWSAGIDETVAGLLSARPELHTLGSRIAVRSRDLAAITRVRDAVPGTIALARLGASAARHSLALLPPDISGVTVPVAKLDAELVATAAARGLAVTTDLVMTAHESRWAAAVGATAIESNQPAAIGAAVGLGQRR